MTSTVQSNLELTAVLNLVPYLDTDFNYSGEVTLGQLVKDNESKLGNDKTFKLLKAAVDGNSDYANVTLVDQSSTNNTAAWKDDLIQGCTFRDGDGNYFVAFRGTGNGRWADNGDGMTAPSTEMQEAAREYFDSMAEKYFINASEQGKEIFVTGHSKGGNEAQYVFMTSKYEHLIDGCYSLDGQGFSGSARKEFKKKYGPYYEKKLEKMYSVCGENDFVHDLGYVIIPEENTYFVETSGNELDCFHALENMIGDDNTSFVGLQWDTDENGNITHGEQGVLGRLAKKISEEFMKLDDENLNGAAIAVMTFIDPYANDEILGSIDVSWMDYVDLFAHGVPVALETLLLSEEGIDFLKEAISTGISALYEEYGAGGVIAGVALAAVLLVGVVAPLVLDIVVISNLLDFVIETVEKIKDIANEIKESIIRIKEEAIEAVRKVIAKAFSYTAGYKYAEANPYLSVDTYKLAEYADRIREVNTRIAKLDGRLDALYWKVGLLGLWNLMQADILTGYSWRLNRCADYLSNTAADFENLERELAAKAQ